MTWYYEEKYMDKNKKNFAKILIENAKNLPIIVDQSYFDEILFNVEKIMNLNNKFIEEKNSIKKWLKRTFGIDKLSKKLENYYQLDFEDFLKEMKKKKVDIKQRKTQDLLENEFNESMSIIKPLQNEIQEIENKINQLVYELYGLTSEDIVIIENSFQE